MAGRLLARFAFDIDSTNVGAAAAASFEGHNGHEGRAYYMAQSAVSGLARSVMITLLVSQSDPSGIKLSGKHIKYSDEA